MPDGSALATYDANGIGSVVLKLENDALYTQGQFPLKKAVKSGKRDSLFSRKNFEGFAGLESGF
jgi:hypothetical protein